MIIKVFIIIVSIWFVLGIGIKLIEKPMVNYVWNKSDQKSAELERHFEDTYGRFQDEQRSIELKKKGGKPKESTKQNSKKDELREKIEQTRGTKTEENKQEQHDTSSE